MLRTAIFDEQEMADIKLQSWAVLLSVCASTTSCARHLWSTMMQMDYLCPFRLVALNLMMLHIHSTLAKFSHCQLQWRICRRLLTHTVISAKCTVMPKMGGEAVSHQTFRLHVQAGWVWTGRQLPHVGNLSHNLYSHSTVPTHGIPRNHSDEDKHMQLSFMERPGLGHWEASQVMWVLSSSKVFPCSSPTASVGLAWCPMEMSSCGFCWSVSW